MRIAPNPDDSVCTVRRPQIRIRTAFQRGLQSRDAELDLARVLG